MTEKNETYSDCTPTCPYCGYEHYAYDDPETWFNDMTRQAECAECGKVFDVNIKSSFTWTCKARDEQ